MVQKQQTAAGTNYALDTRYLHKMLALKEGKIQRQSNGRSLVA